MSRKIDTKKERFFASHDPAVKDQVQVPCKNHAKGRGGGPRAPSKSAKIKYARTVPKVEVAAQNQKVKALSSVFARLLAR